MKTIFKIAAIAAITALAVISCGPPDLPKAHNEFWDNYNDQFDAGKYTGNLAVTTDYPAVSKSLTAYPDGYTSLKDDNTVTLTFPDKADVLKKDTLTTADLNFISFYTYNATNAATAAADATSTAPNNTPTSLNELTGWSFDRRSGNVITLKLPALNAASSKIVYKLDSSKYTYSNGIKPDKDGNGVSGEKVYDDDYKTLGVSGITNNTDPVLPGNQNWYFTLSTLASTNGTEDTTPASDYTLASAGFSTGRDTLNLTDYDNIIKALASGFKVETFSNGSWSASGSNTGVFDDSTSKIIVRNFSKTHNTPFRVVFEKGSISLETSKEFFGVKQRIYVGNGSNYFTENAKIKKTRLEGTPGVYINTTKRNFKNFNEGSIYHPPVTHQENNTDRPSSGYWDPGFIEDDDWNVDNSLNLKPDVDATDPSFDPDDPDNYYQPGDAQYRERADDPNPVYIYVEHNYSDYQNIPDSSEPDTSKDTTGWKWVGGSFQPTSWEQKTVEDIPGYWDEGLVEKTIHSQDSLKGKIVLKLQLSTPITKTESAGTSHYYFKEIDLAAFKNNFKIYSASGSSLKQSNDVVEIGIEKVEFKTEGISGDATNFINGKNVIYITLDPKYRQDGKDKHFYLGDGFGYADGITVFSSGNIWEEKGFKVYFSSLDF